MKRKLPFVYLFPLALFSGLLPLTGAGVEPVPMRRPVPSPNGQYEQVRYDGGDGYYHLIYPAGHPDKAVKTPEYFRGTEVIFSPDSRHFALNWYAGSDNGHPLIFWMKEKGAPKELAYTQKKTGKIREQLDDLFWIKFMRDYDLDPLNSGHHRYCYVLEWLDNDTVLLGGHGHGFESPRFYVDSEWCQLYSLKTGSMTADLEGYNKKCRSLPERAIPPCDSYSRNHDEPAIVQEADKFSITLGEKDGGQTCTGGGKGGIIRSDSFYDNGKWFFNYLILNNLGENGQGTCGLWKRQKDGKYVQDPSFNLSDAFIQASGWQLPAEAVPCIYGLCSLSETRFLIQGYAKDSAGGQIAWSTLVFDAEKGEFSSSSDQDKRPLLRTYNDGNVHLFSRERENGKY